MVKMIASWGSGGSGKTVIASAIAAGLARRGQNVIVIGADTSVPALPVYIPKTQVDSQMSLGNLLSGTISSPDDLVRYIHVHPRNDRIGYMGLVSGESVTTYKPFEHSQVVQLLKILDETSFNYIIFDCNANPAFDTVTMSALQLADVVTRSITPDVKGIEFERAHLSWLKSMDRISIDEHIRILSPVLPYSPTDAVTSILGQSDFTLPFSGDIYNRSIAGELIESAGDREGIQFQKNVTTLVERIMKDERIQ